MKTITIDLWGTLIKSSPSFSEEKFLLTSKYFPGLTAEEIEKAYVETKKELNSLIEATGWQPERNFSFRLLFSKLDKTKYYFLPMENDFIDDYFNLSLSHPPIIYSEETHDYMEKLASKYRLILSSNLLLLNSQVMRNYLDHLNLKKYFKWIRFSDECGFSKPDPRMYKSHFHIGDNQITDYLGPKAAGSTPFIINSNDKTIKDAYNFIIQN